VTRNVKGVKVIDSGVVLKILTTNHPDTTTAIITTPWRIVPQCCGPLVYKSEVAQQTFLFRLEVTVQEPNGDNVARGNITTTTTITVVIAFLELLTHHHHTSSVLPLPLAFMQGPISHEIGLYKL
jgi:hypothetical protein